MGRSGVVAMLAGGTLLLAVTPAHADDIAASGNLVTGGLAFTPSMKSFKVGDVASWIDTDVIAPHTATEDHGLWDLGGGWGETPINPPGFGPGTVAKRIVEAGTAHYYCRVHPTQMKGVLAIPVTLSTSNRKLKSGHKTRTVQDVKMTWDTQPVVDGQGFDVQYRRGNGNWITFASGSTSGSGTIRAGVRGTVTAVRAKLRSLSDAAKSEDWSPDATVTSSEPVIKKTKKKSHAKK